MKTSNIILISAIGSITLLVITGAMQIRFGGSKGPENVELQQKKIETPYFQYLIVNDVEGFLIISSGDQGAIEIAADVDGEMPDVNFHSKGDTLYIEHIKFPDGQRSSTVILQTPHNDLVGLQSSRSKLNFKNYSADVLIMDLNRTHVYIGADNSLDKLQIRGENECDINFHLNSLDTLDLQLDRSKATIHASVIKLQGAMRNHSELSIKEVYDFEFRKDESSRLNHWD